MKTLKEATSEKHKKAETMPFNIRMFKGLLNEEEYLLYLIQQLQIFQTIEKIGLPSDALKRASAVQEDINELTSKGNFSNTILKSTQNYTEHLNNLNSEQILPHVYLNYLAIMFGGQIMKKKVPSSGKMYEFGNTKEGMQAIRQVQKDEWAEEVNRGYDFIIEIFNELERS
jgi:heme oxygenase